jgi:hypothetical protein
MLQLEDQAVLAAGYKYGFTVKKEFLKLNA